MKRWNIIKPLQYIKRGITSLFVCAAVMAPVVTVVQWSHVFTQAHAAPSAQTAPLPEPKPSGIQASALARLEY